jgi:4'-phosphopantetheinyl transferase
MWTAKDLHPRPGDGGRGAISMSSQTSTITRTDDDWERLGPSERIGSGAKGRPVCGRNGEEPAAESFIVGLALLLKGVRRYVEGVRARQVIIWRLDAAPHLVARLAQDPRESARAARIQHSPTRDASLAAAALVRLAVADHTGADVGDVVVDRHCPDCDRWHGRPVVVEPAGVDVSVSHSGRCVAVAVVIGAHVGVDVEAIDTLPEPWEPGLAVHVMDAVERQRHPHLTRGELTRYWVRKEALLKASGDGLRVRMPHLRVSPPAAPAVLEHGPAPLFGRVALRDVWHQDDRHLAAVAVLGSEGAPDVGVSERDGQELLR